MLWTYTHVIIRLEQPLYEEPGGARPDRLSEVRPQDRDLRRTVDQIVDAVPDLPALDVPVPQMVDQSLVLLAAFDVLVPEQVIEVPKLSTPTRCPRTVLSMPQTAEQLVEFPNVVSLIDVIRHPVEQTVGGGRIGGLPGFHPGQSSTAFGEADHRAAPRGAPHDFHQNPLPAAGSSDLPETANQWVFRTFPVRKKVQKFRAPRGRNWARTSAHGLRELSWWVAGLLRH